MRLTISDLSAPMLCIKKDIQIKPVCTTVQKVDSTQIFESKIDPRLLFGLSDHCLASRLPLLNMARHKTIIAIVVPCMLS
jgi:hypothetical protein